MSNDVDLQNYVMMLNCSFNDANVGKPDRSLKMPQIHLEKKMLGKNPPTKNI